jgi:hypothetical protein
MSFRDALPASLQEIVQNGLLDRVFDDALVPLFLYDTLADIRPWGAQLGSQSILTRAGLMAPVTTAVTGSDASASAYGFEQYSVKMDQFGNSIDTNMAVSAQALASKFLEDNKQLGINAAQSMNLIAQLSLYGAYGEGTTYATAGSTSSTTLDVADASGFAFAPVTLSTTSGVEAATGVAVPQLQPVSGSNPLTVTVNGVANTVTGVTITAGHASDTLTLGTAVSATTGWAVVSSIAPVQYRPNARTSASTLVAGDVATLALFESAVTRLRSQNVHPVGGAYTAHIAPQTLNELFQDANFRQVYQGRADTPAYENLTLGSGASGNSGIEFLGRFVGIDWVLNNVTPTGTNPSGVTYYRPIVCGDGCLIKAPFESMGSLVSTLNAGSTVQVDMIGGVARILRAPLDRFGQVLSSTWSWIGGYTVGTDMLTGDSAAYKRAVVVEHA